MGSALMALHRWPVGIRLGRQVLDVVLELRNAFLDLEDEELAVRDEPGLWVWLCLVALGHSRRAMTGILGSIPFGFGREFCAMRRGAEHIDNIIEAVPEFARSFGRLAIFEIGHWIVAAEGDAASRWRIALVGPAKLGRYELAP